MIGETPTLRRPIDSGSEFDTMYTTLYIETILTRNDFASLIPSTISRQYLQVLLLTSKLGQPIPLGISWQWGWRHPDQKIAWIFFLQCYDLKTSGNKKIQSISNALCILNWKTFRPYLIKSPIGNFKLFAKTPNAQLYQSDFSTTLEIRLGANGKKFINLYYLEYLNHKHKAGQNICTIKIEISWFYWFK